MASVRRSAAFGFAADYEGLQRLKRAGVKRGLFVIRQKVFPDLVGALGGLFAATRFESAKGGTVTISYKTLEQLEDICRRLQSQH